MDERLCVEVRVFCFVVLDTFFHDFFPCNTLAFFPLAFSPFIKIFTFTFIGFVLGRGGISLQYMLHDVSVYQHVTEREKGFFLFG